MGLLDMTPDQSDQLLNFGKGLLAASGPSRMPVSMGQAMANGIDSMQQGDRDAMNRKMQAGQLQMQQMALDQARMTDARRRMMEQMMPQMSPQVQQAYLLAGPDKAYEAMRGEQMLSSIRGGSPSVGGMPSPQGVNNGIADTQGLVNQRPSPLAGTGISEDDARLSLMADPTGKLLSEKILAARGESIKPVINRGFGIGTMVNGKYVPDQASLEQALALERGKQNITAPMESPVTIKLSGGQEAQLSRPEYAAFQQSGQLPARYQQRSTITNPGNLRPQGASTGFQSFATPEEGLSALDKNLQSYGRQGINTVSSIISRWAPPSENDTNAYIADVSKRLGVKPDQPFDMSNPIVRQALSTAITLYEHGPSKIFGSRPQAIQNQQQGLGVPGLTQSQPDQINQTRQIAGGKAVDEAFAKDYVDFTAKGGGADAAKQLSQLKDVVDALGTKGSSLTGPYLGLVPDAVKSFTNPNSIAMRERVEEVVQRSLRAILGAQFTEKEGERLIARAYNPSQPESENAIRVGRLYEQLKQGFDAKQDAASYFQKNGTLEGWNGRLFNIGDFDPVSSRDSSAQNNRQSTISSGGWSASVVK